MKVNIGITFELVINCFLKSVKDLQDRVVSSFMRLNISITIKHRLLLGCNEHDHSIFRMFKMEKRQVLWLLDDGGEGCVLRVILWILCDRYFIVYYWNHHAIILRQTFKKKKKIIGCCGSSSCLGFSFFNYEQWKYKNRKESP